MNRLLDFSLTDSAKVSVLRDRIDASAQDDAIKVALGLALAEEGCSYQAAFLLRPHRSIWKSTAAADQANSVLKIQTWWNQNWKQFVQLKRAGDWRAALLLLEDRFLHYWDQPSLLVHLAEIATEDGQFTLSDHLYRRVDILAQQGLPKMKMDAFAYVSQAGLIDNLQSQGRYKEALQRHREITPNHGNAMSHEMQHIKLLTLTGDHDRAMDLIRSMMTTAKEKRSGYSRALRQEFIEHSADLEPLRSRVDWGSWVDNDKT